MNRDELLIGLGGNLGDVAGTLRGAVRLLGATPGWRVVAKSGLYRSRPVGVADRLFLNAAVLIRRAGDETPVLATLKRIERELGRTPSDRWDNRVADLDVLLSRSPIREEGLSVPHPLLHLRPFALEPAAEVAADAAHPAFGRTVASLAEHWGRRPVRVCSDVVIDRREAVETVSQGAEFDVLLTDGPADASAWPPQVDLRSVPIADPVAAASAVLDGLLDRPVRVGGL